jgi:hypothetical protein
LPIRITLLTLAIDARSVGERGIARSDILPARSSRQGNTLANRLERGLKMTDAAPLALGSSARCGGETRTPERFIGCAKIEAR